MPWNGHNFEDGNELLTIDFEEYKTETDAAWLLVIDGEEVWLPKSVCHMNLSGRFIEVPRWLCERRGWEV